MSGTKKRGRKRKNDLYFGAEQEEAVKKYLSLGTLVEDEAALGGYRWSGSTEDSIERDKIYREKLREPLNKMVESIIRRYKLYSKSSEFEETHADALSFLMIKFHKFKPSKNKKSYSYYGTVCKHYLLGKLIKEDKKMKTSLPYEDYATSIEEDERNSYVIDEPEPNLTEFFVKITNSIREELDTKIVNEVEEKVGLSLIKILEDWKTIFDESVSKNKKYNKNLILLYIRNMTNLTTKDIRNGIKRYKVMYNLLKNDI